MVELMINGIPVQFPFEPYPLQKDYMTKMIQCLQNEQNGVLESPTGTGKTLSILCSSLAWLQMKKAQMQAEFQSKALHMTPQEKSEFIDYFTNAAGKNDKVNQGAFVRMPQIIYASRTHSQLSQAMNELKRTAYKHMRASILGSRDQMCVHPEIKQLDDNNAKLQMCRIKVKSRSCYFNNRVEKEKDNPIFIEQPVIDIEDLVKYGETKKFCPYYMSKELKQSSDIIFMPYNYLLDPRTRSALSIELNNAIVILDEAHNVEKMCEESASMQIKSTDITLCIEEVTDVMKSIMKDDGEILMSDLTPPDFSQNELIILKEIFLKFEEALDAVEVKNIGEGVTFDSLFIFELFEKAGITEAKYQYISTLMERVSEYLATMNSGQTFQRSGNGLRLFHDLLLITFASTEQEFKDKLQKCYKVHIDIENDSFKRKNNFAVAKNSKKSACRILSFWCFSPGFGMNVLAKQGIKCIVLTSGTLAPLNPLITELELKAEVRLENPHIVQGNQICVKILSKGPDGTLLNSSYRNRDDPKYIHSLGLTISNLTRIIPGGLLIFFPSYPIMKTCQDNWQSSGLWANIYSSKPIFTEPRQKAAFAEVMKGYYEGITGPSQGAIFMGVCRGKVSEGLDFIDANGRAVIVTGLPYPPMKDPKIILKKRYLDCCRAENKEYLSGDDWYSLEATKAVNQAVGRVIRHARDYGAIILLDSRFNNPRVLQQMSKWLHSHVKNVNNFGEIFRDLRKFYSFAEVNFPVKEKTKSIDDTTLSSTPSASFSTVDSYSSQESENLVKIHKKTDNVPGQEFKRRKIAMLSKNFQKSNSDAEQPPKAEEITQYLLTVRSKLSPDERKEFLNMTRDYTVNKNLADVCKFVGQLLNNHPDLSSNMLGFGHYIAKEDRDEYMKFINKYI